MSTEPKTYWERRAVISENYNDKVIEIIGIALPQIQTQILELDNVWDKAIADLEKEFGDDKEN